MRTWVVIQRFVVYARIVGYLTEIEIISRLMDELRIAAQAADDIAVRPRRGRNYRDLCDSLGSAEGACRQLAHWRGDYRWLKIGIMLHEAHRRAGEWLRGVKVKGQTRGATRLQMPMSEKHPLFIKLAEALRAMHSQAKAMKDAATGIVGPVLPEPVNLGRRVGAPVAVRLPSGLIVPSGVTLQ